MDCLKFSKLFNEMSKIKFFRRRSGRREQDTLRLDSNSDDSADGDEGIVCVSQEVGTSPGGEPTDYEGRCGLCGWNPRWLEFLNSPKALLASLCYFLVLQGAVATGFISVGLSSIERRYHLTSALSAFAAISYEIGAILTLPMASYLGARSHKPRVLAVSLLCLGVGSLIFASPQFFSGSYVYSTNATDELCDNSPHQLSECVLPLIRFYILFVVGNILAGCGASSLYTVGLGLLDESTHPRFTPIYLSVFGIMSVLGPTVGFGVGGLFLSLFVDPFTPTRLTRQDPLWVGAWWLGFALVGVLSVIGSVQFLLFPRRLRGAERYDRLRKQQQPLQSEGAPSEGDRQLSYRAMLREYPRYLYRILKNTTFLFATLGIASASFVVVGLTTFMPKFIQVEFSLDASLSSYVIGAISIPSASVGMLLGGLTLFYFKKLTVERLALLVLVLTAAELAVPPLLLFGCDSDRLAGVNYDYPNSSARTDFAVRKLNLSCLSACHCRSHAYQPVCADGVTFFSPCLAGCPDPLRGDGSYRGCSCLGAGVGAARGKCSESCTWKLVLSAVLLFVAITIVFYNNVPFLKLTLRSVADRDRTVALGVQSFLTRLLGSLPGPLVVGGLFDANCVLWQETACGGRGSCLEYDTATLRYSLVAALTAGVSLSTLFFFLAWISWRRRRITENYYEFTNSAI